VEIEGPESVLREISEVFTDIVNISGRTEPLVAAVAIKTPSSNLQPTNEAPISVRVAVDALVDNRTFTEVPVNVPSGWTATPPVAKYVTVHGPIRAINELKADRVRVMLRIPEIDSPDEQTIRWSRRNPTDSGVTIVHGGDNEQIRVDEVGPTSFTVRPTAAPGSPD